ncbi:MAG: rod shape-determining protein MreD [Acidobacteria bacterium]|nr:rod shape-determining protein MreD [Acidobacteriota bacterium]
MLREARTEVHRFSPGVLLATVVLAIFLQAYLPVHLPPVGLLDLPLLVVIYFGLTRRNPSTGLLLGLAIGITQDALSSHPVGQYGMAKTLIGFAASSVSIRIDTDQPASRLLLVFLLYFLHQLIFGGVEWLLLARPAAWLSLHTLEAALVNALLAVLVFHLLDRFRRPP